MDYTFLVQFWDETDTHYYFDMRKVRKEEEVLLNNLNNLVQNVQEMFGRRRLFSIKYTKATKEIQGYYYNTVSDYETRKINEEETQEIIKLIKRFQLKIIYDEPEGRHKHLERTFYDIHNFITSVETMIELQKEYMRHNVKRNEQEEYYKTLEVMMKSENMSAGLSGHIIFKLQEFALFNPP